MLTCGRHHKLKYLHRDAISSFEVCGLDLERCFDLVVKKILDNFPWNVQAIIVTGSLATNEYTQPIGDIDLLVITRLYDPFLDWRLKSLLQKTPIGIEVSQFQISSFKKLNTMLVIDTKNAGKVIYGDKSVLSKVDESLMHKYEGVKVFFNYSVMKLNSCVSKQILESKKLSKEQNEKILRSCMKTFEGICAALLILRKKYRIGYKARADHFSKIYCKEYNSLYREIPDLTDKIKFATKLRFNNHFEFEDDAKKLWFSTRQDVARVLPFIVEEYFHETKDGLVDNVLCLNKIRHDKITSLLYAFRLFMNDRKLAPLKSMFIEPVTKVHIAGACILFSFDSSLSFNREFLKVAEQNIQTIFPIALPKHIALIEKWEEMRRVCVILNEEGIVSQLNPK